LLGIRVTGADIILDAMVTRLLAEAGRTGAALGAVARHLAWYVSYHLDLGDTARAADRGRAKARRRRRGR
jgi:hypothetical protein